MYYNQKDFKSWLEMNRSELQDEYARCGEDPIYFITRYVKVEHQVLGLVPFSLFPFQERIIKNLQEHRFNILRKFRQAGCTTIACAYALWICIFMENKTVAILSIGDTEAMEVLDRIKIMYDELPPFLQPAKKKGGDNKHMLHLETGCRIKARPAKRQSGRSLSSYFLIIDEGAFIEHIDYIWAAVYPIISTGGNVFVLSTVNGMGNWYHELWEKAIAGTNEFNPVDIKWQEHPQYKRTPGFEWLYESLNRQLKAGGNDKGYDVDAFESNTKRNMGVKKWRQEYLAEFLGTGDTYVDGETLTELHETFNDDYWTKYNNRVRVWKDPESHKEYVMGVDVGLGRDRDNSAFHVADAYTGELVAECYTRNTPINDFAKIIAEMGTLYNTALVVPERNTIGNNLIDRLFNIEEYDNLYMEKSTPAGPLFGLQVTTANRDVLLADMEEFLRNKIVKVNSERTVKELLTFIINDSGKAEADENQTDDLVMSLALTVYALKVLIQTNPMLSSTLLEEQGQAPLTPTMQKAHSYGGIIDEDISWLIK